MFLSFSFDIFRTYIMNNFLYLFNLKKLVFKNDIIQYIHIFKFCDYHVLKKDSVYYDARREWGSNTDRFILCRISLHLSTTKKFLISFIKIMIRLLVMSYLNFMMSMYQTYL